MVTASLLTEIAALQRAVATGMNVSLIPPSSMNATSTFTASSRDGWLNSLWLLSLALTLIAALLAGLVKQWLHYYLAEVAGTPKQRALTRHFRYLGLNKWHVSLIIELLPVMMNISLALFFVGLILYTQDLSLAGGVRWILVVLTFSVFVTYIGSSFIPLLKPQCPYKTSLSRVYNGAFSIVVNLVIWGRTWWDDDDSDDDDSLNKISPLLGCLASPNYAEQDAISKFGPQFQFEMLAHTALNSTNSSASEIALQAFSAIPISFCRRLNKMMKLHTNGSSEFKVDWKLINQFFSKSSDMVDKMVERPSSSTDNQHSTISSVGVAERCCRAATKLSELRYWSVSPPWYLARLFGLTPKDLPTAALLASFSSDLSVVELVLSVAPIKLLDLSQDHVIWFIEYARKMSGNHLGREEIVIRSKYLSKSLSSFLGEDASGPALIEQFTLQEFLSLLCLFHLQTRTEGECAEMGDRVCCTSYYRFRKLLIFLYRNLIAIRCGSSSRNSLGWWK